LLKYASCDWASSPASARQPIFLIGLIFYHTYTYTYIYLGGLLGIDTTQN
jgi:hypothetical protein